MNNKRNLAIVGVGPRGLYALENLIIQLNEIGGSEHVHLYVFEKTGKFGYGDIYDVNQLETNWINISERILCLDRRNSSHFGKIQIPSFPSYHEWSNTKVDAAENLPDHYPPRAKIGNYLKQRFETLVQPLVHENIITKCVERVESIQSLGHAKIRLETNLKSYEYFNEVLFTIGHQPTKVSNQIAAWNKHADTSRNIELFEDPYPIERILNSTNLNTESKIGVRGFGLAMIDIVRGIATKFGEFQIIDATEAKCSYTTSHTLSNMFVPFSLDGLPPSPKPLNAKLDVLFKPTETQISIFESTIGNHTIQRDAENPNFLVNAFTPIAAKIYLELTECHEKNSPGLEEVEKSIKNWLKDEKYEHGSIIPRTQSAEKSMREFVGMATGKLTVSLDYCVGQVWRHCQPSIYKELSFNACKEEVFAAIIHLDERLKRYSYGPPVESIQQMLALISSGIMNLNFLNDPKINPSQHGWQLESEQQSTTVGIMINSVLDAPEIKSVDSPVVKNLLSNDLIKVAHDDFGVATDSNGYLIPKEKEDTIAIALLGRLAKGTIIGVDAILECFGRRPKDWAIEAAKRHLSYLQDSEI